MNKFQKAIKANETRREVLKETIRDLVRNGLSKGEIAGLMGVPNSCISRILNGEYKDSKTITKYLNLLGLK